MSGRGEEAIAAMRRALAPLRSQARDEAEVARRLSHPHAEIVPARVRVRHNALVDLFVERAERAAATVDRVESLADVPGAVARYLEAQGLPPRLIVGSDALAAQIPWPENSPLERSAPPVSPEGGVSLAGALGGVAESGSVVIGSGAGRPYILHLLAETHIIVVRGQQVLATQEALWARLRNELGEHWPRALTLLTGPSRTADIELIVELGAHGPRRLHLVVVEDA